MERAAGSHSVLILPAKLAKRSPQMAFTSLAYLIDIDWLKEAYGHTRKDGAVGVDGVT